MVNRDPRALRLPAHPFAQIRDVRGVVARMPGVQRKYAGEGLAPKLGMIVAALELSLGEGFKKRYPALMKRGDHGDGSIDGQRTIGQARPCRFIVGLDSGPVLGQGKLGPHVSVGVAVGDVVYKLAYGPAAIAIRSIELRVAEPADGGLNITGKEPQDGDLLGAHGRLRRGGRREAADGIAEVVQLWHIYLAVLCFGILCF
jgi:hypothetical protein